MIGGYDQLLKKQSRSRISREYAALTLNAAALRMFKKGQKIKKFLKLEIRDGRTLAHSKSKPTYDKKLTHIIRRFQSKFQMNRNSNYRRPNFGEAAKMVNLYVKHLIILPDYVRPYSKRRLEDYAHVVLDRYVLERVWGDFRQELKSAGIGHRPHLRRLEEEDYARIQKILANAARKRKIPTIAYDYLYALREK